MNSSGCYLYYGIYSIFLKLQQTNNYRVIVALCQFELTPLFEYGDNTHRPKNRKCADLAFLYQVQRNSVTVTFRGGSRISQTGNGRAGGGEVVGGGL